MNKEDAVVGRQSLGGTRAIVTTIGHVQAAAALMDAPATQGQFVLLDYCSPFVILGRRSRPDRETARGRSSAGADPVLVVAGDALFLATPVATEWVAVLASSL
jgi:hypothetical protein